VDKILFNNLKNRSPTPLNKLPKIRHTHHSIHTHDMHVQGFFMPTNAFAAGALHRTQLRKLPALPKPPIW